MSTRPWENLVQALEHFRIERNLKAFERRFELLQGTWADNRCGNRRVGGNPGQSDGILRFAKLAAQGGELFQLLLLTVDAFGNAAAA
ncbi:hypothetical protein D3C76_1798150 [compost metagenome]